MPEKEKNINTTSVLNNILIIILLLLGQGKLYSQDIFLDKSMLDDKDRQAVEKLEQKLKDAGDKLKEANETFLELSQLESDYTLTPKELEKKSKKLQSKANQTQNEALTEISETNSKIWKIYNKQAKEQTNLNESQQLQIEQASGYWEVAEIRLKDAGRAKTIEEKISILNESIDNQNLALSTEMLALGSFVPGITSSEESSTTYPEPISSEEYKESFYQTETTATNVTTGTGAVVNENMIIKYDDYVNDPTRPDPIMVNRSGVSGNEEFTLSDAEKVWNKYQYGELPEEEVVEEPSEEISYVEEDLETETSEEETIKTPTYEPEVITEPDVSAEADEYIYRVQIAANVTQLSQRTLQKMYSGNKKVEMIEEKGWFKYSIGDFESFQEADRFRNSSGMPDAFIVRYRKGQKFYAIQDQPTSTTPTQTSSVYTGSGIQKSEGLLFNVQIAASKVPLGKTQIASIYKGNKTVTVIVEDGWFKYQIQGFKLYNDARQVRRNCGVNGAFIVAYRDGQKQALDEAIKQNKSLQEHANKYGRRDLGEIDYFVQIAASKVQLSEQILQSLNPASLPVRVIIEEDWYKYQIPAGKTFGEAQSIKQQISVHGAFIVPYKRGDKTKLYQARQETK